MKKLFIVLMVISAILLSSCTVTDPYPEDAYFGDIYSHGILIIPGVIGDMTKAVYDPANIVQQLVGISAAQSLTNKQLTMNNADPIKWKTAGGVAQDTINLLGSNILQITNPSGSVQILGGDINLNYNIDNDIYLWGGTKGSGRELVLYSGYATAGSILRDSPTLHMAASYWDGGAAVGWSGTIIHDMQTAGATPKSQLQFSINSASILRLENNNSTVSTLIDSSIDWTVGNITYVPISGNIQTYVNNATSGDTLILASGKYVITSTITVNKELNIVGQGNSGFATTSVTPSHGTLISSTVGLPNGAFNITNDNVRIAHISIDLTGASSLGVNTANNLKGIVLTNIDVIVKSTGYTQGFTINGSNAVLRDLTFYITSTNNGASGVWIWNDSSTTQNAVVDCFNVTGTVVGSATYAYAFVCENINDANTITLNLSNSVCKALAGTPDDVAVKSTSTTTNNAIVNAYFCTLDGQNYDVYQTGTNQLNVGGSVLVNGLTSGNITYRATMTSGKLIVSGNVNLAGLPVYANNAAALGGGLVAGDLYRTNSDPDTVCVVH